MFEELGHILEVVVLSVFKHENSSVFQAGTIQYAGGKFAQLSQLIGRIGKNKVERTDTTFYIAQRIALHEVQIVVVEAPKELLQKRGMLAVFFYTYYGLTAPRQKFKRYATRAPKQVEHTDFLKIYIGAQYIEQIFFGKVGRRAGLETTGNIKSATFIFSCDDSHRAEGECRGASSAEVGF